VRKIISILVALGLVLAFSATAAPSAGAACTATVISNTDDCAGEPNTVCINFTSPVTLMPGNDKLSLTFPAGTTFPTWTSGDITVEDDGGGAVSANVSLAVVTGTHVSFPVPNMGGLILAGSKVQICIDVVNPLGGTHQIDLDYELVCCGEVTFDCATWVIKPGISDYSLMLDFGPTYPGIAKDFVPPFKACGQADNATGNETFNTTLIGGLWYDQFDIVLVEEIEGCDPPCANATFTFNVTAFPTPSTGAVVSLNVSGEFFALTPTAPGGVLVQNITLTPGQNETLEALLHFNLVGEYEICFDFTCPGDPAGTCLTDPPCVPATGPVSIVDGPVCYPFNVHQWKDAAKMVLNEKWNLVSLPLVPFDTDIGVLLASLPAEALDGDMIDELLSIWHYDDEWSMYNGGGLTDMVDGASYWVRMTYPNLGAMPYNWWVWGTARPMPPAGPAAYAMAAGWNMLGFTSLGDMTINAYLWNFTPTLPLVYGWNNTGSWMTSGWLLKGTGSTLNVGQGYWGYFTTAGTVVPP
jgi:hypothetical protein